MVTMYLLNSPQAMYIMANRYKLYATITAALYGTTQERAYKPKLRAGNSVDAIDHEIAIEE